MVYNPSAVLTDATALLRSNPKLTLFDVTRALGLERHTIEKAVRTLTSMTFRQWRLTVQMEQAAQILASSNLTIKETAFSLGYRSPRSFSRAFRARLGVSPVEYRRAAAEQDILLTF